MRKQIDVRISTDGRDKDKVFFLTEMPALQAEKWAMRALMAVARSGIDIGQVANGGMQALAVIGIQAVMKLDFGDAEPLLDEMLTCIQIKPNPQNPGIVRPLMPDDIEEVSTLFELRKEVLDLHMGFSQNAGLSKQTSGNEVPASNSSNIPTSHDPSVRFSRSPRTKPGR